MKIILTFIILNSLISLSFAQEIVKVDGKKFYLKTSENIVNNFKVITLCQDQKGSQNCGEYFVKNNGEYTKLPISKSQLSSALKASNFKAIKGIKKYEYSSGTIYYFQNSGNNIYMAKDESDNLVLYPVSATNDVFTMSRRSSQTPQSVEEKCNKACPMRLPENCTAKVNGIFTDCFLRAAEDCERCRLKCKGKIRTTTSIAAFEGIVINTKSN